MCRRSLVYAIGGFLASVLVLVAGGYWGAQRLMIEEVESRLSFEQTVSMIQSSAKGHGWEVPKVYELCKGLAKHGYTMKPVAVIELCKPQYAAKLLQQSSTRVVSSFMPCRISVYERDDGKVIISRMNTALVSRLFRGEIAEVMARATKETQAIIDEVITNAGDTAG